MDVSKLLLKVRTQNTQKISTQTRRNSHKNVIINEII